ncbi:MAG: Tfp pilus assembly protein FimT/FimU [Vulcanimicrobiota bacterium]
MRRVSDRGFSLLELMVVLIILGMTSSIVLLRYNVYEANHACKSAAQILISDIRFQQQRAISLECTAGMTISPGGNSKEYVIWSETPSKVTRRISFGEIFRGNVCFRPGQEDRTLEFYGQGTLNDNEWAVVKKNSVSTITLQGGNIMMTVHIDADGRARAVESRL